MIKVTLEIKKEDGEIEIAYMELESIAFAGKHFDEESVLSAVIGRYSIIDKIAIASCLKNEVIKEVLAGEGEDMLEDFLDMMEGGYDFD